QGSGKTERVLSSDGSELGFPGPAFARPLGIKLESSRRCQQVGMERSVEKWQNMVRHNVTAWLKRMPSYSWNPKRKIPMPRFISLTACTNDGRIQIDKSTARAAAFREAATEAGVKVESLFWTVGAYDGVLITSADTEQTAVRCLSDLNKAGFVRT